MGYVFRNRQLLTIALTHRSKTKDNHKSYERLEFLGDSILELIISEYLYKKYPKKS
ncbi:MAG: ribonuclease III, partial [Candidatus Marinimicrobia bacterium]|nr:ribonuclease III [Candidatus Neomarinimicrobiota bacterium]